MEDRVPDGWTCTDGSLSDYGNPEQSSLTIWGGPGDAFGAFYRHADPVPDAKLVGRARITHGTTTEDFLFEGPMQGFVRFEKPASADFGEGEIGAWTIQVANSSVAAISTQNVQIRTTAWDGNPWVIYEFPDGSQSFFANTMTLFNGVWRPLPGQTFFDGEDFSFDLKTYQRIVGGDSFRLRPNPPHGPIPLPAEVPRQTNCQ